MVATSRVRRLPRGHRDVIAQGREAWLARALATGPAHRASVESALVALYAQAALPEPVVMRRASPPAGAQAVADLVELAQAGPRGRRPAGPLAVDRVLDGALDALDRALRPGITERTRALLEQEVAGWLQARLRPIRAAVEDAATQKLGRAPGTPLGTQLPLFPAPWQHILSAGRGHLGVERVAVHDAARRLGIEHGPEAASLIDALTVLAGAGWCWTFERLAVICERPADLRLDYEGRLHGPDGPAAAWADGSGLFAWHGRLVPRRLIEVERLTVPLILAERNIELRRLMIERYGIGRFRCHAGARLVHEDRWGSLWRPQIPGDEPLTTVEVVNATPEPDGRRRRFELRVPPTMRTALGAVAWTFGVAPAQYARRMRGQT